MAQTILGLLVTCTAAWLPTSSAAWAESQDDHLTEPVGHYKEALEDATATLDFYPYSLGASIIFDVKKLSGGVPSLELQGRMLNQLLSRLLNDHPDIKFLHVRLAGNREALIEPLNKFLVRSPEWNSSRGRPRHGQLGTFLTETINSSGILAPLCSAFSTHGFRLELQGVGRIDIEKIQTMNDARLPLHIDEMSFLAVKTAS